METVERKTTIQFGLPHRGCTIPIGWLIEMIVLIMLLYAVRDLTKVCERIVELNQNQIENKEVK